MNIASLWIYPLKSARGISVPAARVETRGLAGDRRWMLVDDAGVFLSQRSHPRLTLVSTHHENERLKVEAEGVSPLVVPIPEESPSLTVEVWNDTVLATPVSEAADAWFSDYLGTRCRLVYMPDTVRRPVDSFYASASHHVSFADGFPMLLIGTASLADLNTRLDTPITMRRFRPNIVVETEEPFIEDAWQRLAIGDVVLELVKSCARCSVTTVDPETGARGKEPLRTLTTYRRKENNVLFGQNAIVQQPGTLRVGAPVEPL